MKDVPLLYPISVYGRKTILEFLQILSGMTGYVNTLIAMKVLIVMGFSLLCDSMFFYNYQIVKFLLIQKKQL